MKIQKESQELLEQVSLRLMREEERERFDRLYQTYAVMSRIRVTE